MPDRLLPWVTGLILPAVIGAVGWFYTTKSEQIANDLQRNQLAGEYLALIGDPHYEKDKKSLLMANLLREKIVDPELLFALAYRHESKYGGGVIRDLMYEYSNADVAIKSPVGTLQLPGNRDKAGKYALYGWFLDKDGIRMMDIWVNGGITRICTPEFKNVTGCGSWQHPAVAVETGKARPDVSSLIGHLYPNSLDAGFKIALDKAALECPQACVVDLKVRVSNVNYRHQVLFDGQIVLEDRYATQVLSKP